jgi:hypothetical protein
MPKSFAAAGITASIELTMYINSSIMMLFLGTILLIVLWLATFAFRRRHSIAVTITYIPMAVVHSLLELFLFLDFLVTSATTISGQYSSE